MHKALAICLLLFLSSLAFAAPMKVLVIGGPGGSYCTQKDAMLAELLARAYGWETRFATFFTVMDDAPMWRLGADREAVRQQQFREILSQLREWQPDVTLARLPRKDFNAITPEIQQALVERVKAGMGLVAWSTEHGSVDYTGEPLLEILAGKGFGGDYTGGMLDAAWKWTPHRLTFGLPLDQSVSQMFFDIPGKAADFQATDLVLTGNADSGRIRVREAGKGRVVMLGHNTTSALGPAYFPQATEPFTMEIMDDHPDWGQLHLRLIQRAVLWARGEQPAQRIAVNIPPLSGPCVPGATLTLPFQVLNETGQPVRAIIAPALNDVPLKTAPLTAPIGLSEQRISVTIPSNASGWLPLEISLRGTAGVLGSPPATALRYLKITLPVAVTLTADRRGAPRGEVITLTAAVQRNGEPGAGPLRLMWTINDYQRRVLTATEVPLALSGAGTTVTLRWTMPFLDPTHYRYVARATLMRGTTILGDATLPLFRAERFRLDEGLYHGVWTNLETYPEALHPTILDLYEDAGYRGLHTGSGQVAQWNQEDRNWRGYCELSGGLSFADWALLSDEEALAKGRKDVEAILRRMPLADSGAYPVISLGEEAPLLAHGAPLCDIDEKSIPAEEYGKIRAGYLAYLQRTYGTLEKLNAQWDTGYAAWDGVEMPWKYFNFYYPNKAMPSKGVTNMSQAVDQWGYMREVWQKALDAHTKALQEINPTLRTMESTGNFYDAAHDVPNAGDTGHDFRLDWAFSDDTSQTQAQFGNYLVNGVTMGAYWFDFPLTFNPDLTHTRASSFRKAEFSRLLERAPVILHTQGLPPSPEVVLMRPHGAYPGEFHTLLGNVLPQYFIPNVPEDTWRQLLHISGAFPGSERTPATKLLLLPMAIQLSPAQGAELAAFVRNGGTLVTTAGLAGYDLHGKPYTDYPGAGMAELLGVKMTADYFTNRRQKWTLSAWPGGKVPATGTLFSVGRDAITTQAPDVQVLAKYDDGVPALLYRKVGQGQVLHINGVYYIPYTRDYTNMPYWPNMGKLAGALLALAGVTPPVNVLDEQGQPLESLSWNLAGAGTMTPGAGDVRLLRLLGSLTPAPVRIVSTQPVAFARDALTGRVAPVRREGDRWVVSFTRGPEAAHYLALFPYVPAKMTIVPAPAIAGSLLEVKVRILDAAGKPVSGRHAVTVRATLGGLPVSQWKEIAGEGVIGLPLSVRDAGKVTITAMDWTSGLQAQSTVTIPLSPLAARLPAPLPPVKHGMLPRQLSGAEVNQTLTRLATVYAMGPQAFHAADEAKWRLGYYTFMLDESRHNLSQRLLAPADWDPAALRGALKGGARWILTGEDLGIDRLQGQLLTTQDHLGQLEAALAGATPSAVAGAPDQIVYRVPGGGRVLLDRRSFDYWSTEPTTVQAVDWDQTAVSTRTSISSFSGSTQQFTDAYRDWWQELQGKGLFGETPDGHALLPVPKRFNLREWWQAGFQSAQRQQILAAAAGLRLPSARYQPPAQIAGYQVGAPLLAERFEKQDDRWSFERGKWQWEPGKLAQVTTSRDLEEGAGWGGLAILNEVANPQKTPLLIAADGRISFGYGYGKFGIIGGYLPGQPTSGLTCQVWGSSIMVGKPETQGLTTKPAAELVKSPTDSMQFLLLLDGNTLRAKVWNRGTQPEPADWQFTGTIPDAQLGSALALETEIVGFWDDVRVWALEK